MCVYIYIYIYIHIYTTAVNTILDVLGIIKMTEG